MTMYRSASPALVMNALAPSSTYVSPSRTARVCSATASLPPAGLGECERREPFPRCQFRQIPRLLVIIAENEQWLGADREVHVEDHRAAGVGARDRLDELDEVAMRAAGSAVADRCQDARETGFACRLDESLRMRTLTASHRRCDRRDDVVDESGDAPGERSACRCQSTRTSVASPCAMPLQIPAAPYPPPRRRSS